MKFVIEIEGETQPDLIDALKNVIDRIKSGGTHLQAVGVAYLSPKTQADAEELREQYRNAHPNPTAPWVS